jgi:hypothetical protein
MVVSATSVCLEHTFASEMLTNLEIKIKCLTASSGGTCTFAIL